MRQEAETKTVCFPGTCQRSLVPELSGVAAHYLQHVLSGALC